MNTMPMKVLHVMPEFPYPPVDGARADTWERLRSMNRLGCSVDAVVIKQKVAPEDRHVAEIRQVVSSLRVVERLPLRRCLAGMVPTRVGRNYSLAELPLTGEYDLTLMEGEDAFPICGNSQLRTRVCALRVHNDESAYMRELARAEENFLKRQFWRLETLRFAVYSRFAFRHVSSLWFISARERDQFVTRHPAAASKAVWLPPSIAAGGAAKRRTNNSTRVLYVASLDSPLNREALRWYLRNVHVYLTEDPSYELVVAGSTKSCAVAQSFADEVRREARCTMHVNVGDLSPLYDDCALFINPMQRGAGVKMKNIHAIARGIAVLSTVVGNEGSGFADKEHVRITNTAAAFATAIRELLGNDQLREQMAARAYRYLTENYDSDANLQRLFTNLMTQNSRKSTTQKSVLSPAV